MDSKEVTLTPLSNLLMNMSSGLLPEHMSKQEIKMLEKEYGTNWFEKLGYSELKYKKPKKSS